MARLRLGGIAAGTPPRLRIGGISASGAVPTTGRLRIGGISATGTQAVILAPLPNLVDVAPLTNLTVTAGLAGGSATPDSYTWRVLPGSTPVGIIGTGATVTIKAPAGAGHTGPGPAAGSTTIGVRGIKAGIPSPEVTFRIDTLPHQWWFGTSTGYVPISQPQFA